METRHQSSKDGTRPDRQAGEAGVAAGVVSIDVVDGASSMLSGQGTARYRPRKKIFLDEKASEALKFRGFCFVLVSHGKKFLKKVLKKAMGCRLFAYHNSDAQIYDDFARGCEIIRRAEGVNNE